MKIVKYPHPALRFKAVPVTTIDRELEMLAGQMLELMYKHNGLGLAAPQVAYPYRLVVMNFEGDPEKKEAECVAINPTILETKGIIDDEREGCLSFPDLFQKIRRARTVRVKAYNLKGEPFEMVCSELAARLWQHETDHLDAKLFIDKMGPLARMASRNDLRAFEQQFLEARRKGEIPSDEEIAADLKQKAQRML